MEQWKQLFFFGFIFKFPVWVSHLSPGKWWKFPWRNLTFSLFCCWSADRSSAAGSVVTIIICHTHTTRCIYSLRNNKWRHIFFSLFFLLAWLVRRCDENDSSGAWRRWPSDVCWLPTAFVAWRFSYTVENKVLICNLVIQSTRKTQQDEDESESETSHKPNGMWVHQKQIEKIKGESRKKPVRLVLLLTLAQSYINPSVVLALNESWRSEIERCCTAMLILFPIARLPKEGPGRIWWRFFGLKVVEGSVLNFDFHLDWGIQCNLMRWTIRYTEIMRRRWWENRFGSILSIST